MSEQKSEEKEKTTSAVVSTSATVETTAPAKSAPPKTKKSASKPKAKTAAKPAKKAELAPMANADDFLSHEEKTYAKRMKGEQEYLENEPDIHDVSAHDPAARKFARENNA